MIPKKLFQKYFLMASALIGVFVFLGFFLVSLLMEAMRPNREFPPPIYFARLIDRMNPKNKIAALKELSSWNNQFPQINFFLFNEKGQVLFPENKSSPLDWSRWTKPSLAYDFISIPSQEHRGPHFPLPFAPPGPPPPQKPSVLVKLSGTPNYYLLISPSRMSPPKEGLGPLFPFIGIGSLIISLLLGVGTALAIIYQHVQNGVQQADRVIAELHKGNLKARFHIHRKDEFGRAMERFNFMADEIEQLVNNLKSIDQKRTQLLQELAHDLRTPIASLKNLNETLDYKRDTLKPEIQQELFGLARKEINYFEKLVEDLLFLAQIQEPLYPSQRPPIVLNQLIAEEADDCVLRNEHKGRRIHLVQKFPEHPVLIHGDLYLLRRLFRNAFENASSFAKNQISTTVNVNSDKVHICIVDDGPGFSVEALNNFGNRRTTRNLDNKTEGRISIGLGSVVMKTICEAHRGKIEVSNLTQNDPPLGAKVDIYLHK
ncbi:MAG: HAMP domain-containing histidine kinase [Bdellovibrionales bacterium]|nr:HAMP domain-containing histidine kinase [Bdellovibrionales bacterium]